MTCSDVTVSYDDRDAVCGASFALPSGDFLSVVGENGSGKSTLVKAIAGLVPLSSGEISFCGNGRLLGYLPQHLPEGRDFPASVQEVVMSGFLKGAGMRPFYSRAEKSRAQAVMDELSISKLKRARFATLSGGQKQRVLLARAICAADGLLVLDEPVAGLDPIVRADFYSILKELNRGGMSIIMVSHDIAEALAVSSLMLHMSAGRIAFFGDAHDYRHSEIGMRFLGECDICRGEKLD